MNDAGVAVPSGENAPERVTLGAFVALILMVGINANAVKPTVAELVPMWSARVRFAAAGLILISVILLRQQALKGLEQRQELAGVPADCVRCP